MQRDLKKLLRNPPLVKVPKIGESISVHPFMGALPSDIRQPLEGSTKEVMKLRGTTLYKEGSKANGVWLVSSGVVKVNIIFTWAIGSFKYFRLDLYQDFVVLQWTSKSIRNRHSLHPVFTHGSTLGLYEVLIGKPYICDIVTDSVALCFFIDKDKILSALRADPAIEEFLWQVILT